MFSEEDILKLKRYCQSIIHKPLPIESQKCIREGDQIWLVDWEIIEICKYLFNGAAMYRDDPPPNRLKHNTIWSKEVIKVLSANIMFKSKNCNNQMVSAHLVA